MQLVQYGEKGWPQSICRYFCNEQIKSNGAPVKAIRSQLPQCLVQQHSLLQGLNQQEPRQSGLEYHPWGWDSGWGPMYYMANASTTSSELLLCFLLSLSLSLSHLKTSNSSHHITSHHKARNMQQFGEILYCLKFCLKVVVLWERLMNLQVLL